MLSDENGRASYDRGEDEDAEDDSFDMPDDEFFLQVFQNAFGGLGGFGGFGGPGGFGGRRRGGDMDFIAAAMQAAMFGGFAEDDEDEEDEMVELLEAGRLGCRLCNFKTRSEAAIFDHITEKHSFFSAPPPRRVRATAKRGKRVRVGGRRI